MGIYVKFTKTTHQIWSCHVTLASNCEKFYLLPNFMLNFRKCYQIWGKLSQEQKRYRNKTNWGGGGCEKHPRPVLIGLIEIHFGKVCYCVYSRGTLPDQRTKTFK